MASHPDDIYGSLLKLSEYVEAQIKWWDAREEHDEHSRLFFWQPMLVVGGDLFTITLGEDTTPNLSEAQFGRLEFNWHNNDQPCTTVIEVVKEDFLLPRLAAICAKDEELEERIYKLRQEGRS